ncbi:hypothetical protein K470DRAFT_266862 [Piedraia hortae CBS 480.64]|uniref:Uncharacterized protein n=1 Tax=Piedraia hortae CBS 480.64 TaxID=1314780 RepID=A0A6A7BQL8_9PEZI|nr:hypothetical protein K470DRAFT_266862 [Piedraia hortae CBS 480.64]
MIELPTLIQTANFHHPHRPQKNIYPSIPSNDNECSSECNGKKKAKTPRSCTTSNLHTQSPTRQHNHLTKIQEIYKTHTHSPKETVLVQDIVRHEHMRKFYPKIATSRSTISSAQKPHRSAGLQFELGLMSERLAGWLPDYAVPQQLRPHFTRYRCGTAFDSRLLYAKAGNNSSMRRVSSRQSDPPDAFDYAVVFVPSTANPAKPNERVRAVSRLDEAEPEAVMPVTVAELRRSLWQAYVCLFSINVWVVAPSWAHPWTPMGIRRPKGYNAEVLLSSTRLSVNSISTPKNLCPPSLFQSNWQEDRKAYNSSSGYERHHQRISTYYKGTGEPFTPYSFFCVGNSGENN